MKEKSHKGEKYKLEARILCFFFFFSHYFNSIHAGVQTPIYDSIYT